MIFREFARWAVVLATCVPACAGAYDAQTHQLITYRAYRASDLTKVGNSSIIGRLGLDRLDEPTSSHRGYPFNVYWSSIDETAPRYYDSPPGAVADDYVPATQHVRGMSQYEVCQLQVLQDFGGYLEGDPILVGAEQIVARQPLQLWLLSGVLREDDIGDFAYRIAREKCGRPDSDPNPGGSITRVMNHFYDPINDRALEAGLGCALLGPNHECLKSVDWALGYVDSFVSAPQINAGRRNHFTYVDARNNMWLALTAQRRSLGGYLSSDRERDSAERLLRWATTFRSLGDVVHLLEDGAQPQHVRNDAHNPGTVPEKQAYESYTNARVLRRTANGIDHAGGRYVRDLLGNRSDEPLPPVVIAGYQIPKFATPLRFFTTRAAGDGPSVLPDDRLGLMDYANRGFFTGGTLPQSSANFLRPEKTIDPAHHYTRVEQPCELGKDASPQIVGVKCAHWTHAVPDSAVPNHADQLPSGFTEPPLVSESVFQLGRSHGALEHYAIGVEELQTTGNLALPRAASYAAGLINYFFRGALEVTPPSHGVFAILNHGETHAVNAQGYPCVGTDTSDGCQVFGFTKIRLRVRNANGGVVETESGSGAPITQSTGGAGAKLVAIAQFHRNPCYTPSLTGEKSQDSEGVVHQPDSCPMSRTLYQEIAVSTPRVIAPGELDGSAPLALEFDFTGDPIPVNATDVLIQVVYRGPLGAEPDGIAVGRFDVSEPTYASLLSMTDLKLVGTGSAWGWQPVTTNNPDSFEVSDIVACQDQWQIYSTSSAERLGKDRLIRIALLRDSSAHALRLNARFRGDFGGLSTTSNSQLVAAKRQADNERGDIPYRDYQSLFFGRGIVLGDKATATQIEQGSCAGCAEPPSPWVQAQINPPASGFISEPIGTVRYPGEIQCPIYGVSAPQQFGLRVTN